jgi:hypothetical protein
VAQVSKYPSVPGISIPYKGFVHRLTWPGISSSSWR